MRLTMHTDYALRTLIYLTVHREEWVSAHAIADAFKISRLHLGKVVQSLARAGFVETRLGRQGGLRLARDPERIRIGDVVRGVEPSLAPVVCLNLESEETCVIAPACGLVQPLKQATQAFLTVLDGYTIAECAKRKDALGQLLTLGRRPRRSV
jgi:Rrf2 family nitric oxide-sensitive transcriptional repressor